MMFWLTGQPARPVLELRWWTVLLTIPALMAVFAQSIAGAESNSVPASSRVIPPAPVPFASPVAAFRELLSMTPQERREALTNRPPEVRKRLLAKLREYESLKPEDRESRLRATELRWYLQPLLSVNPTNRAVMIARVPPDTRSLVQERLARWDRLPPETKQELLNNEVTARYFAQLEISTPEQWQSVLSRMSPERRAKLEAGIDQWRKMSEDQRQKTIARFNQFFELTPAEQARSLNTLTDLERRQMEKTLQMYDKLTPAQREECIRSFEKFAAMSLPERQLFLKNAEQWKLMSASERRAWRSLVSVAPLKPPVPMPPSRPTKSGRPSVATN